MENEFDVSFRLDDLPSWKRSSEPVQPEHFELAIQRSLEPVSKMTCRD